MCDGDIGNVITVSETPLNGTGSGQIAFSAASSAVIVKSGAPVNAVTPVISGNIGTVGAVLTASNGNWSGVPNWFSLHLVSERSTYYYYI